MIAIPLHQLRVAPVLDWCSTIVLIPRNAGESWHDGERLRVETNVFELLRLLRSRNVSPVICGALSPNALRYGQDLGLEFICGISGAIDEVVAAYRAGELDQPRFRLPGCRCPGCSLPMVGLGREHHVSGQGGIAELENRGKDGAVRRQTVQGRDRRCAGRQPENAVGVTACVCPQCGREVPHRRGVPCKQLVCQACGTPLVRKPPAPGPFL